MNTPEFLIWAIELTCPVRGFQDGSDPERTERQLRAARAVSDARRERRVFEGLCVDPPDGFRIQEALALYGNLAAVEQACGACPANALKQMDALSLAGCCGLLPLPGDETYLHAAVEQAIDRAGLKNEIGRLFSATQPRWYGLWMNSPLAAEQAAVIERLFAAVQTLEIGDRWLAEFTMGLQTARVAGLPLHHALYPRGLVAESRWRPVAHCPHCHAPWNPPSERRCNVCGYAGHPAPEKKRHARGRRPYFPLDRLLGAEPAAEFLIRYEAYRGQPASPDRECSPPPPAPLDNRPAG